MKTCHNSVYQFNYKLVCWTVDKMKRLYNLPAGSAAILLVFINGFYSSLHVSRHCVNGA